MFKRKKCIISKIFCILYNNNNNNNTWHDENVWKNEMYKIDGHIDENNENHEYVYKYL